MDELKPCPFCGGKAKIYLNSHDTWTYMGENGERKGFPHLHICACVEDDCATRTQSYENAYDAIKAWNRRVKDE